MSSKKVLLQIGIGIAGTVAGAYAVKLLKNRGLL